MHSIEKGKEREMPTTVHAKTRNTKAVKTGNGRPKADHSGVDHSKMRLGRKAIKTDSRTLQLGRT